MTLKERINTDFVAAFKAKDTERKDCLGMLKTAITNAEKVGGKELKDEEIVTVVQKQVKQANQVILGYQQEMFKVIDTDKMQETNAKIGPALKKADDERVILEAYLPQQMSDSEMRMVIDSVLTNTVQSNPNIIMGEINKYFKANYAGQFDGGKLKNLILEAQNNN